MTTRRRGKVWLVLFPHSDLVTSKPRPVVVVQGDRLATGIDQSVVAMVSSNMDRVGPPSRVRVDLASPEGVAAGLKTDSVVMADNLATIDGRLFYKKLGDLPSMPPIDVALRAALDLS